MAGVKKLVVPKGMVKQHFSTTTNAWENCGAEKRPCPYAGWDEYLHHRLVKAEDAQAAHKRARADKRSFFAALSARFGTKQQAAQQSATVAKTAPVSTPAAHGALNEIVTRADGRFEVFAHDGVSEKGEDVYPFGDLVTDAAMAKRLHDVDPEKLYQNGDCGVLAAELWNRNKYVEDYYVFAVPETPVFGIHQFVKLIDGTYVDSMGIWSERVFVDHWKTIDDNVKLEVFDDGEPVPPKDLNVEISNQKLFDTVTAMIDAHFAK